MLDAEVSLFIYLIEMLIALAAFSRICQKRYSTASTLLIGVLVFSSGAAVNIMFANTVWLNAVYTVFMNCIFAVLCFHFKFGAALLYSFLMDLLSIIFEFVTVFFVSSLIGGEITEYNSDAVVLTIESGISKVLYFLACILLLRPANEQRLGVSHIQISFFLYPISTFLVLMVFWYICAHEKLNASNQMLLAQTSLILLAGTVVLYISFRHSLEKDNELSLVKRENLMLQTEKSYYDLMKHQNEQLMIYAHDAKKHLSAIQGLNSDPLIDAYLEKLLAELKEHARTCQSGNKILDVIINKYATECQMLGIDFTFDVRSCPLREISEIDLVAILGNLLDNAITAANMSSEKIIVFETTARNSYDVIVISNSCDHKPASDHTGLVTTKEGKRYHGYGIRSVRKTLKKYNGDFDYDYNEEQRIFTATVMIGQKA